MNKPCPVGRMALSSQAATGTSALGPEVNR